LIQCVFPSHTDILKKQFINLFIGIDEFSDPTLSLEEALNDTSRIDYFYDHLYYLQSAVK